MVDELASVRSPLAALLALAGAAAPAQSGAFDSFYGAGGAAMPALTNNVFENAVVQSDGKIVAVGRQDSDGTYPAIIWKWIVARFHFDGSPDLTFNASGTPGYRILFGTIHYDTAVDVALDASQRIYVVGNVSNTFRGNVNKDLAVIRLTPDGNLDASFGSGGMVIRDFAGNANKRVHDYGRRIEVLPSGKLLVAGITYKGPQTGYDILLVQLLANGSLDTAGFGNGKGYSIHALSAGPDDVIDMAIDSLGRIVIGAGWPSTTASWWTVARYGPTGVHDAGFGPIVQDFPGVIHERLSGLAIQPWDNAVVAFGRVNFSGQPQGYDAVVARYTASGSLDPSFNGQGWVTSNMLGDDQGLGQGYVMADGRIVSACQFWTSTSGEGILRRYHWDGTPDLGFGGTGASAPSPASLHPDPGEIQLRFVVPDGLGNIMTGGNVIGWGGPVPQATIIRYRE